MDETVELMKLQRDELAQSRAELERLANDVMKLSDIVNPSLKNQVTALREARMSTTNEVNQSLTALREVRKFFLSHDYEQEMARLERFVSVCREIQSLKADGVFDAVVDSAIRLAVKETR